MRAPHVDPTGTSKMAIPAMGSRIISVKRAVANVPRTPLDRRIAPEQRLRIEQLLRERISLRGVCRAVGVSLTWLLPFMVECFTACPRHPHVELPAQPGEVVLSRLEAAADEMWSFVHKKANKQWIWIAMDAKTRQILSNSRS